MTSHASAFWSGLNPPEIPPFLHGAAVVIGNFDGVHRGHKAVIEAAKSTGLKALALSFEPHPRSFFRLEAPVRRLTWPREKLRLFEHQGLDGAVILTFDAALAAVTAEDFLTGIILSRFKARHVVVGYDFHFGKGREGSPDFLRHAAPALGLGVTVVPPFGDGDAVSSSAIRGLLEAGAVPDANRLLGHRWFVTGTVEHGDKRGRDLGYPTANITLPPETPLKHGIYAVRTRVDGRIIDGVASFGRRPTFDDGAPRLEAFLFDFSADLYGKELEIEFVDFIRPEEKFGSIEALVAQMDADSRRAREMLARSVPAGTSILECG